MTALWIAQGHANQRDIIQLIRTRMPQLNVIASHSHMREDILAEATSYELEPNDIDGPAYAQWLLSKATDARVTAVMAFRHRKAVLAIRSEFHDAGIHVSCGATTTEALETAERKDLFTGLLSSHGITVPQTIPVRNAAEMRTAITKLSSRHGICVKPITGVYGRGFWILSETANDMQPFLETEKRTTTPGAFLAAYEKMPKPEPFLVMEYLPGDEYSVDCVCADGKILAAASRRKMESYQLIETSGAQIDLAQKVAQILKLDGLINTQIRLDAAGKPHVLETNTRPAGGVGFSASAGVNLPAIWAQYVTNNKLDSPSLNCPLAIRPVTSAVVLSKIVTKISLSSR